MVLKGYESDAHTFATEHRLIHSGQYCDVQSGGGAAFFVRSRCNSIAMNAGVHRVSAAMGSRKDSGPERAENRRSTEVARGRARSTIQDTREAYHT